MNEAVGAELPPMVVPVSPFPDESLPGLIARSACANIIRTTTMLEDLGDLGARPGFLVMRGEEVARPLGIMIGCKPTHVVARSAHFSTSVRACPSAPIDFNGITLMRRDLELTYRRISPVSVARASYHRSDWLNLLLPYCRESLELLVDRCQCGAPLRWVQSWRTIGHCETCRQLVRSAPSPFLEDSLAEDYRLFAKLASTEQSTRAEALSGLSPELQALGPGMLVNFILHLGATCQYPPVKIRRNGFAGLGPMEIATIVCTGTSVLHAWPSAFRTKVGALIERTQASGDGNLERIIAAIRTLPKRASLNEQARALIRKALPESMSRSQAHLSRSLRPIFRAGEACRITSLSSKKLKLLRDRGLLDYVHVSGKERVIAQYDREQINDLASRMRGSKFVSQAAWQLALPAYAVEQLGCLDMLEIERHPAINIVHDGMMLVATSVDSLAQCIVSRARSAQAPKTALPLESAMRMFGGEAKPWASVVAAVIDGSLRSWHVQHKKLTRATLIEPADLQQLVWKRFERSRFPNERFGDRATMNDMSDLLNMAWIQINPLVQAGELAVEATGKSTSAKLDHVLSIAAKHVSAAEAAFRVGCSPFALGGILKGYPTLRRGLAGWDRKEFNRLFPEAVRSNIHHHAFKGRTASAPAQTVGSLV